MLATLYMLALRSELVEIDYEQRATALPSCA
jgi:hypothetical protein